MQARLRSSAAAARDVQVDAVVSTDLAAGNGGGLVVVGHNRKAARPELADHGVALLAEGPAVAGVRGRGGHGASLDLDHVGALEGVELAAVVEGDRDFVGTGHLGRTDDHVLPGNDLGRRRGGEGSGRGHEAPLAAGERIVRGGVGPGGLVVAVGRRCGRRRVCMDGGGEYINSVCGGLGKCVQSRARRRFIR